MAFPPPLHLYCVNYARVINLSRAIAIIYFPPISGLVRCVGRFWRRALGRDYGRLLVVRRLPPSPPFFSPPPYFSLPIVKQQVPSALLAFPPLNPATDRKRTYEPPKTNRNRHQSMSRQCRTGELNIDACQCAFKSGMDWRNTSMAKKPQHTTLISVLPRGGSGS